MGQSESEGIVLQDEEYRVGDVGARITLQASNPGHPYAYAIECGVYGWMVHTRYFGSRLDAMESYNVMKPALVGILLLIPEESPRDEAERLQRLADAIRQFIEAFPP